MRSLPAWTPGWLRRHPALLVEWLRFVNALSRWREDGRRAAVFVASAVVSISAAVAMVALSLDSGRHAVGFVDALAKYWLLVAVIAAVYAASTVARRRRQVVESQAQSWLIATPIPPSSLRLSHAIRTLFPLVVMFLAVLVAAGVVALASDGATTMSAIDSVPNASAIVIAAVAGGLLVGGFAGWWAARGRKPAEFAASRYVLRPKASGPLQPDASALAHWPTAQVMAWSRPENSRYLLIIALLAVQGGSSAVTGLSVVAMYFVASYLAALLSAMIKVAEHAAAWLRATPMTLGEFVWALSRRALLHQVGGTVLAGVVMLILGSPIEMALQIASLWLVLVLSISGFALIDNYRGRSPAIKIALSVATFAALAMAMQFRAGAKA
ncbi:hypothetical protein [Steroidobacter sp.]|uniref:hypothetical protein n=1 Tax=Steroidobacter sp. TaxID=1978227 RepID=UPI001A4E1A38|nr:hypothetical protein [Steroidobacter sp.]MBL8269428.1 hypothetical protein [Steroidobacter sp.]